MDWEIRDWRALAVGYGIGIVAMGLFGISWWAAVIAIIAAAACRQFWR